MLNKDQYNDAPIIKPTRNIWFLNGDLVRSYHINRAAGIMSVYNINNDRIESCLISDFKKNRERAYSINATADLVNRNRKYMPDLMNRGVIPQPTGASIGKKRGWRIRAYYSESQVREIRDILATQHIGRPRKDGLVTNSTTPTYQELTRRMGDGILTYRKTEDGQFVPLWTESI